MTKVASDKGWAKFVSYDEVAKASASQGVVTRRSIHDRDEPRRVRDAEPALRARRLPGSRRLHQEHDHGRGADGRRHPGGERRSTVRCRRRASTCCSPGRSTCRTWWCALNKVDAVDDPELLDLVELEVRELLSRTASPATSFRWCAAVGAQGAARRAGRRAEDVLNLMEALDSYVPLPQREIDKPFLMPIEDVFSISGRGTVVTGRVERGKVKVGEEIEIVGFGPSKKKIVTGVEMFRKLLDRRRGGRQHRRAAARHGKGRSRARPGAVQARLDHAAHEVQGRGLHPDQGRGRPSHAVLQRLSSAVLHPDDRRDRVAARCPKASRW